ncbi:MAG: FAD-dependent oxidoreductase [Hymenobacter sp.]
MTVSAQPTTTSSSSAPARPGSTAAYELGTGTAWPSTVLEADDVVGGISRTAERDGWRFDIGGHRFFTKVPEVEALWHEILADEDFLLRPADEPHLLRRQVLRLPAQGRRTRCATSASVEAVRCVLSYVWVRVRPPKDQSHVRGLGRRPLRLAALPALLQDLHREGVGRAGQRACQADWAAQRIKNLSLSQRRSGTPCCPKRNQKEITSLIEEFQYPKYGPGMMWERCRELGRGQGCDGRHARPRSPSASRHDGRPARSAWSPTTAATATAPSTRATTSSRRCRSPQLLAGDGPAGARRGPCAAADDLRYRDFLTVALVVPRASQLPGQLDLHPRPGGAGRRASRTSARGRRTW